MPTKYPRGHKWALKVMKGPKKLQKGQRGFRRTPSEYLKKLKSKKYKMITKYIINLI